jgi:hypothetical protein
MELGTFIDSFETVVTEDYEQRDENGNILFIFRKNVIPEDLAKTAWDTFNKIARKKNDNRGYAAGLLPNGLAKMKDKYGVTRGNISQSNIVGYYDKPGIKDKKKFPGKSVCRLTSFNSKNKDLFQKSEPFFQCIDKVYRECAPVEYQRQLEKSKVCHQDLIIKGTVFSTVTCNYNWRTACHTDSGDFKDGLGNLTVISPEGHVGGIIGFPKYNIGIDVQSRDVLLMNSHEVHCNTALISGERLSFVCYLRDSMHRCINKEGDFYTN